MYKNAYSSIIGHSPKLERYALFLRLLELGFCKPYLDLSLAPCETLPVGGARRSLQGWRKASASCCLLWAPGVSRWQHLFTLAAGLDSSFQLFPVSEPAVIVHLKHVAPTLPLRSEFHFPSCSPSKLLSSSNSHFFPLFTQTPPGASFSCHLFPLAIEVLRKAPSGFYVRD